MPTENTRTDGDGGTVVAEARWVAPAVLTGLPLLGAALGWGLVLIAEWITGLSWFPFQGLFELLTDLPRAVQVVGGTALGLVVGLVLAVWVVSELLTVTVGREGLRFKRGDDEQEVARGDVASVFLDGKRLVVLGHRRQELAQTEFDLDREQLAAALRKHGYLWQPGGDPYGGEFKRWVPGAEGLPSGADALLKARDRALEKSDEGDLRELREELAGLGVVVRDRDKKQYWRRSDPVA
ncbi:hypothetical protein AB0A73_20455 [Glycomyces sp. NPDC047369]